jgi:D-alanyl-D-alanine carboxypeptidase (penicillin-binding protein 5/6)
VRIRAVVLAAAFAAIVHSSASAATPKIDARAYEVVNAATGEVLLTDNARTQLPMASITKLMTVLVALERAKLDDVVEVDRDAVGVTGSGVRLRAGERLTVRDLVAAAIDQSANDAAIALAAHVSNGDEDAFVALMNRRARQFGLDSTHFERADGLDVAGHVSTAHDLNRLGQIAMRQPVIRELALTRNTSIAGGRSLHTWNDLLGVFPGIVGVKTGHTSLAGWCQVAAARGPGFTIYATILGSPTRRERNADLADLLAYGLSRYRLVPVIAAERTYAWARLPYGRDPVALVAARPAKRPVRLARALVERVVAPTSLLLPVRKGQRVGEVRVYDRGKLVASSPLVASRSVELPGRADKVGWYAKRTLHHLGGLFS